MAARARSVPPDAAALIPTQAARRERIVRAALAKLTTSSYEDIQMKDVAELSGVALGTVYRYFNSKEHLFGAVILTWASGLERDVRERPLRGRTDATRLVEVYSKAVRAFDRTPQFLSALRVVEQSSDPYALRCLEELRQLTNRTYKQALRTGTDARRDLIVFAATATMNALLTDWSHGVVTINEVGRDLRKVIHLLTT